MITRILFSLVCLLFLLVPASAQECLGLNMKAGSGFEMSSFDGKGKPIGTITYKITKVESEGSTTVFTIDMESFTTKGKSDLKNTYQMKCNGNILMLDASTLISPEQRKSFDNMEMKFTYDNIEYPTSLAVGQKLKDASVKGDGKSGPMGISFNVLITNRTIASQEKLTIPAGTYDAFKINSDMTMETVMGFPIKVQMQNIAYRTPGVIWDLKNETYRKGKLVSYSELTKIY